jgi:hypothetical protein
MEPLGLSWEWPYGASKGPQWAPGRTSMGTLEGPHEREKVKQYLTRDLRGHEVGPNLVARRSRKSALMGPLKGPIGGLNRDYKGLYWDSF